MGAVDMDGTLRLQTLPLCKKGATAVNESPEDPLRRFSNRVADYVRYRPSYPAAFYELLRAKLGVGRGNEVADVGSGPGISARPLLEMGATVYCVEPNGPMREAAERLLGAYAGFRSVPGTAEGTTLGDDSVDLVLCAQAFHWFDRDGARGEFRRILKPGRPVVLVWNERRLDATAFLRDYEALLHRFGTDYQRVRHENVDGAALSGFFGSTDYASFTFENRQEFDYQGLEGRLKSSSYTPSSGDAGYGPMIEELRRIFDRHQVEGRVRFEYDTRAHVGRVDPGR
jgi:SAM-dependent methyltransferase